MGPSAGQTKAVAVAAFLLIAAGVFFGFYWTQWRHVDVKVNGESFSVRVGTTLGDFLKENDYFDVKAGKLLSLSGKELEADGGDRCAVTVNGSAVAAKSLASTKIEGDEELAVTDGADTTEDHTEETVTVQPEVQQETGGAIQYVSQWGKAGKKTVWKGKVSGETEDKQVLEEKQDMIIASRNPSPDGGKYIALTFDDGPSQYTPGVLKVLREKGVKATFFNLGQQAESYSSYSKQVVDEGHEMASHTNKHQYLPELDRDSLRDEITSAATNIKNASGVSTQMIRAPYGSFGTNAWLRTCDLISCNVLWTIDTEDWKLPGASAITQTVLSNAYNGAIVLMHDGGGDRSQDVEALPDIIDGLKSEGYEFVTIGELMRLDGDFPKEVYQGKVTMPKDAVLPAEVKDE